MSALAMILTAAMVVPGDGPGKASGEVSEKGRGLDLKGKWEGSLRIKLPDGTDSIVSATYHDGKLAALDLFGEEALKLVFIDQGKGRCRCRTFGDDQEALGIYKWQRDQLFICLRADGKGRPTNFTVEGTNLLLILHRVKSSR